ncbi:uncharacterized protein KQ657_000685 [Scheffersomyces spartinae]|uniref:SBE2/SBE22 middle domain-containing protein n=1 Tax=Scheffersomyces spartinae TaxID=45513 RepID=A0A9P7V922_9ASCO|nr:uncharacterized protein KQ657_000685 [Scheffersomyces spartinae]KAG7193612.1 hypothetical protein KQ657_000685 [Scheffersomyces spartinae]
MIVTGNTITTDSNNNSGYSSYSTTPLNISPVSSNSTAAKRPGDYYIQRLTQSSSLNGSIKRNSNTTLAHPTNARPKSGDSITSLHSSTSSDDSALMVSTPFDSGGNSRLSSMTSHSIVSEGGGGILKNNRPLPKANISESASSAATSTAFAADNAIEENDDTFEDQVNTLLSTLNLKSNLKTTSGTSRSNSTASNSSSMSSIAESQTGAAPPKYNTLKKRAMSSPSLNRSQTQNSSVTSVNASHTSLTRTKSKYINPKQSKERKQMRKQRYEENIDDDILIDDDFDLVFNVPIIKSKDELFVSNNSPSKFRMALLDKDDQGKYNINVKPCPLPGQLSRSLSDVSMKFPTNSTLLHPVPVPNAKTTSTSTINHLSSESVIVEEDADSDDISQPSRSPPRMGIGRRYSITDLFVEDDSEISRNISQFYSLRSASYSRILKINREQELIYKLPAYVRSQSSVEDLHLMSKEKLELIDQTRPIHLPPKGEGDKLKHAKEIQKIITTMESNTKSLSENRVKSNGYNVTNLKRWGVIHETINDGHNLFSRNDKNYLRKLAWESTCPENFRLQFFQTVLRYNHPDTLDILKEFQKSEIRLSELNASFKKDKDNEIDQTVNKISDRPLFKCCLSQALNHEQFKSNLKQLIYLKTVSSYGLAKHDDIFLLPALLAVFSTASICELFELGVLINEQILTAEFFNQGNTAFGKWSDLKQSYSISSYLYKSLGKFQDLNEFDNLTTLGVLQLICQFNDQMPLSMSAPSTPLSNTISAFSPQNSRPNSVEAIEYIPTKLQGTITISLITRLLQVMVVYGYTAKTSIKNNVNIIQCLVLVVEQYYHMNWMDLRELIQLNKLVKLNNSADLDSNLEAFTDKWMTAFKKF